MSDMPVTNPLPALSRRPRWGWLAWEMTVGYISRQHSPDAALKLEIYPLQHHVSWAATLSWQDQQETVRDQISLADTLSNLWMRVDQFSGLTFGSDALARIPAKYGEEEWLDQASYTALSMLVNTTDTFFSGDWSIVIVYRPIEVSEKRLTARLIAQEISVNRGASAATLRDVCRTLYLNTLPDFRRYQQLDEE